MVAVDAIVNEAVVRAQPAGVVLHALTGEKTATVTVTIPEPTFEAYHAEGGDFGINARTVHPFVAWLESDSITMTSPPNTDRVRLATLQATYSVSRISPASIRQRTVVRAQREPIAAFSLSSDSTRLANTVRAAGLCGVNITIHTRAGRPVLAFSAEGDADSMHSAFRRDDLLAFYGRRARATYSLDKLAGMYAVLASLTERVQVAIDRRSRLHLMGCHLATGVEIHYTLDAHGDNDQDTAVIEQHPVDEASSHARPAEPSAGAERARSP